MEVSKVFVRSLLSRKGTLVWKTVHKPLLQYSRRGGGGGGELKSLKKSLKKIFKK